MKWIYFVNTFKHFKKICIHKYWVFYYCCKAGIPFQGLIHDLSKFSPTEFIESIKYYQGTSSPIDACKKDKGWSAAWMHPNGLTRQKKEKMAQKAINEAAEKIKEMADSVYTLTGQKASVIASKEIMDALNRE